MMNWTLAPALSVFGLGLLVSAHVWITTINQAMSEGFSASIAIGMFWGVFMTFLWLAGSYAIWKDRD